MKKLTDYKDEIHRCSKCGLCQSVCPVYKVTGNDCTVSRGKFIMLNGVVKEDLDLNKNVNKYLDMCLKCNACKNFCPSNIDAREIFQCAKNEYFKKTKFSKIISVFQSKYVFENILKLVGVVTKAYRFLKLDKFVALFYPLFTKFAWIGKKIILANEFVSVDENRAKKWCNPSPFTLHQSPLKIVYFKGCVNEYINPSVKNSVEYLLSYAGVEILPLKFDCCGLPFLSSGNIEQFKKQAEFNLSQIPDEFNYFVTDCESCKDAFELYKTVLDDSVLREKLDKVLEKSMNINDFLLSNVASIEFDKKVSFTFHKPCHMKDSGFISEILKKSKNIEYVEMVDFDSCCGFAGEFALKNAEISESLTKNKAKNALNTEADYILTSCPSCVLGINQGLIENNEYSKFSRVLNFAEFFAQADKIIFTNKSKEEKGFSLDEKTIV